MANRNCEYECDWPSCIGCVHNRDNGDIRQEDGYADVEIEESVPFENLDEG